VNSNPTGNTQFNLGVSGHRDLNPDDAGRLRSEVTGFLADLKSRLPDTEIHIIVGMAAGADLMVAQAALDLGLEVEAVLPMPLTHYREDFAPQDLAILERLLDNPGVRRVELLSEHALTGHGITGLSRDGLYENLSQALIRRSSLLLALWDGTASPLPGGTADTVLRFLGVRTERVHEESPVSFLEAEGDLEAGERLVYWVPTARVSNPQAPPPPAACYLRGVGDNAVEMQPHMPAFLRHQLAALNHYNLEFRQLLAAARIGKPDSLLAALPADTPLDDDSLLADIDAQYGKADALAVYYQLRSDRLFVLFGMMTLMMGATLLVYEKISESPLVLMSYTLILLTSLGAYYVLRGRHWFAKHLTYRAIAETMRAKFYLRLAGVDHRVDAAEVMGRWGIDRFHGFGWIGYVLKGVESRDIHGHAAKEDDLRRIRCVEQTWIENQHAYFSAKVAILEASSRRVKWLGNAVFVVILGVMLTLLIFGESMTGRVRGIGVPLNNLLTFSMELLVVALGVSKLHQDKMATRELLWQYRNQLDHFARARRKLARIGSPRRRNDVLVELGKDSLMESYLWTIHRYHREHEPPSTG
jgi:hypothetical protein